MATKDLGRPCSTLHGVGPQAEKRLATLGIKTVEDLLWHIPFRYEDRRAISTISELQVGQIATIRATLSLIANRRAFRRRMSMTEALVEDATGSLKIIWFNQPYLATTLKPGERLLLSGRVSDRSGVLQLVSPTYEKTDRESLLHLGRLVPMYPTTSGLTERQLRYFIFQALKSVSEIADPLPDDLLRAETLLSLSEALQTIHFPNDEHARDKALERLKFDELFLFQLRRLHDEQKRTGIHAPAIPFTKARVLRFVRSLPFTLTNGQRRAAWDILQECAETKPMNRLLEGEVGSGKTVVAAIAALNAVASGHSVVLMAPTEILARQHFLTFTELFAKEHIPVFLVTHGFRETSREGQAAALAKHPIPPRLPRLTIGTHALLFDRTSFGDPGIAIVDEQHRFGVEQRRLLRQKGQRDIPHFLSLTATPIPRSLALTISGDLRLSVLRTLPRGRKPVRTESLKPQQRNIAYTFADREIAAGRQVFILAPFIEPSDTLGAVAVTTLFEELKAEHPSWRIGQLHGKLPSATKDETLRAFAEHTLDALVATPVIEVGIDVPNASVMIIEGAERFGLSELHQLRGRIGRGIYQSTCFLLSNASTPLAEKRLQAVRSTSDGFRIAELDLALRGPGDLAGTMQSGFLDFRFAGLGDTDLMSRARHAAEHIFVNDPHLHSLPAFSRILKKRNPHNE